MMMLRATFVFLLLTLTTLHQKNIRYQLVPSIPPQAFVGQYYTCDFRVQGLENPSYQFKNLPSFLRSLPSGRIQGVPNKKGSYYISVAFKQDKVSGQIQLILTVNNPFQLSFISEMEVGKSGADETNSNKYGPYEYPFIPSIFNTGDYIFLNVSYYYGGYNNLWSYLKLPSQLTGTSDGCINGTFYSEGLYSFGAIHSNQNGKIDTFIITLNIQPTHFYAYWGGYYLEDVPVRDRCMCSEQVKEAQSKAEILVAYSKAKVQLAQKRVKDVNNNIARKAITITLAQNTLKTQSTVKQFAIGKQSMRVKIAETAKDKYDLAKQQYQLLASNYLNKKIMLDNATQKLKLVQNNFDRSQNNLEIVNKIFIDVQNASFNAASDISALQLKIASLKEDFQTAFVEVGKAKQNLASYQNLLTNCSFDASNAQNARQTAYLQNNISESDLHTKQQTLNKTLGQLKKTNQNVSDIKEQLNQASNQLGQAKFNLTQAINQLLVAQAAKAESDKAMALISNQLSPNSTNKTSSFIFGGCEKGAYPSFSGSLIITEIIPNGAVLASGHTLLYGNCTKSVKLEKGDLINLVGYIKDGVISSLQITK